MRHADTTNADRGDQFSDTDEPRPHVSGKRIKLPVHGCFQGFDAPRHTTTLYSIFAIKLSPAKGGVLTIRKERGSLSGEASPDSGAGNQFDRRGWRTRR